MSQWPATTSPPKGGSGGRGSIDAASSGYAPNRDGGWTLVQNMATVVFAERGTEFSSREIAEAVPDGVDQWVAYRRDRRRSKRLAAQSSGKWAPHAQQLQRAEQQHPTSAGGDGNTEIDSSEGVSSSSAPNSEADECEYILA